MMKDSKKPKTPTPITRCESCEFYDYDEDSDSYCCTVGLDQDEYEKFMSFTDFSCRYYRFYDEYKTVQKQN